MENENLKIPPGLAILAAGRDFIPTADFAKSICRKHSTIRVNHTTNGEYLGIKPLKLGNKLMWPVAEIAKILNGNKSN